jgi:hypothetical protein
MTAAIDCCGALAGAEAIVTGDQHLLDPVIHETRELRLIEILEPDRTPVEHDQRVVSDRAPSETAHECEVDLVANVALLPLLVPQRLWIEGHTALLLPAAAAAAILSRADQ